MKTLTVGQSLEDLFALARHLTPAHFTNVVDVRLTTRGLEVETTHNEGLVAEIEELKRDVRRAERERENAESDLEDKESECQKLEERVKQLEQQLKDQAK